MMQFRPHQRLQIHTLRSHSASNLNRDDAGRPKEVRYGGVRRLRLSSQSIKHAMRKGEIFTAFRESASERYGAQQMIRTRKAADILKRQLLDQGLSEEEALTAAKAFTALMKKEAKEEDEKEANDQTKAKKGKGKSKEDNELETQLLALSQYELEILASIMINAEKSGEKWPDIAMKSWRKERKDLMLRGDLSPELQLFGRMITARECFDNIDSPLQVAHAFTTHEALSERDYWIGADDLLNRDERESGAGMIDVRRFGAGVFYHYSCLDIDLLRRNLKYAFTTLELQQIEDLLSDLVEALIWSFAVQNPTGYQNSFASHAIATTLIVELGGGFPHSAAAAFEQPVIPTHFNSGQLAASVKALREWDDQRKILYGEAVFPELKSAGLRDGDSSVTELVEWVRSSLIETGPEELLQ